MDYWSISYNYRESEMLIHLWVDLDKLGNMNMSSDLEYKFTIQKNSNETFAQFCLRCRKETEARVEEMASGFEILGRGEER